MTTTRPYRPDAPRCERGGLPPCDNPATCEVVDRTDPANPTYTAMCTDDAVDAADGRGLDVAVRPFMVLDQTQAGAA